MRTGPMSGGFGPGAGYATDLDVMGQSRTLIQGKHDDMLAEVEKLMSYLETVAWDGPARRAFEQSKLDWHDLQGRLQGRLREIMEGIEASQQQYLQVDTDNQSTLSGVTRGIG